MYLAVVDGSAGPDVLEVVEKPYLEEDLSLRELRSRLLSFGLLTSHRLVLNVRRQPTRGLLERLVAQVGQCLAISPRPRRAI